MRAMTVPDLMRLSYRMAFLTLEMQLTFAARLWGLTRTVQAEAQALVADLPVPPVAAMIESSAPAAADPAPPANDPAAPVPAAPRKARRRATAAGAAPTR